MCDQGNVVASSRIRVSPSESVLLVTVFNDIQLNSELVNVNLSRHVYVRRSKWEKSDHENAVNVLGALGDDCIHEVREFVDQDGDIRFDVVVTPEAKEAIQDRINDLPDGLVTVFCNCDQ